MLSKILRLAFVVLFLSVAAAAWIRYFGQGVGYADVADLTGRGEPGQYGRHGLRILDIALLFEAAAVALFSWVFIATSRSEEARLIVAVVLAICVDALTLGILQSYWAALPVGWLHFALTDHAELGYSGILASFRLCPSVFYPQIVPASG